MAGERWGFGQRQAAPGCSPPCVGHRDEQRPACHHVAAQAACLGSWSRPLHAPLILHVPPP